MNKTRRRIGRRRRHWARVKREMQNWTRTGDARNAPPKRGRLRRPLIDLAFYVDKMIHQNNERMALAVAQMDEYFARAFGSRRAHLRVIEGGRQ